MRTGWEIVIAGRNFDPSDFFRSSRIQPCSTWEREIVDYESPKNFATLAKAIATKEIKEAGRYWQKGIEFTDWHEGSYPLNIAFEALDYLLANREEFEKLCNLPGVENRHLNLHDTSNESGNSFDLTPSQMTILAELKLSLSIYVSPSGWVGSA